MQARPRLLTFLIVLTLPIAMLLLAQEATAIEVAPRISDREIIQELTAIKVGQNAINQRFDDVNKRFDDVNKRLDDVNKRFDDVNKRFDDLNKRFDDVNKRIDDSNQSLGKRIDDLDRSLGTRIDDLTKMTLTLFGALLGLITAFIGFILWDRHSMMKPLEERIAHNASEIKTNQGLLQEKASLLDQLLLALRDLAKDDPKIATVLRNFSLL